MTRARTAGIFYLLNLFTIFLAIFLFRGLIVSGNASATATNALEHLWRFRLAFAFQIVSTTCSVAMVSLLYGILKPVDSGFSLLAALLRLIACGIAAIGYVFQLVPLVIGGKSYAALTAPQLQDVANIFSALQVHARNVSIAFFACQLVVTGYLIYKSTFFPRWLGALVTAAGVVSLTFLASPVPAGMLLYFVPLGLAGELSLALWLAIPGVDAERWNAIALAA